MNPTTENAHIPTKEKLIVAGINILQEHEVYVSAGSACSKGHRSHVLEALGLPPEVIDGSIRISLSRETLPEDLDRLMEGLNAVMKRMKR